VHDFQVVVVGVRRVNQASAKPGSQVRVLCNVHFEFTPEPSIPLIIEGTPYVPKGKHDKVYPKEVEIHVANRVKVLRASMMESVDPEKAKRGPFLACGGLRLPPEVTQVVVKAALADLEVAAGAVGDVLPAASERASARSASNPPPPPSRPVPSAAAVKPVHF
jgi:hypothetical protein